MARLYPSHILTGNGLGIGHPVWCCKKRSSILIKKLMFAGFSAVLMYASLVIAEYNSVVR